MNWASGDSRYIASGPCGPFSPRLGHPLPFLPFMPFCPGSPLSPFVALFGLWHSYAEHVPFAGQSGQSRDCSRSSTVMARLSKSSCASLASCEYFFVSPCKAFRPCLPIAAPARQSFPRFAHNSGPAGESRDDLGQISGCRPARPCRRCLVQSLPAGCFCFVLRLRRKPLFPFLPLQSGRWMNWRCLQPAARPG